VRGDKTSSSKEPYGKRKTLSKGGGVKGRPFLKGGLLKGGERDLDTNHGIRGERHRRGLTDLAARCVEGIDLKGNRWENLSESSLPSNGENDSKTNFFPESARSSALGPSDGNRNTRAARPRKGHNLIVNGCTGTGNKRREL